jgi:hypothetical protein
MNTPAIDTLRQLSPARLWLVAVLGAVAAVSVVLGVRNALHLSVDFLWDYLVELLNGIDPYREYLTNPAQAKAALGHEPNSGHLTFLLMSPFGLLSKTAARAVWALMNVVFAVASYVLVRRKIQDKALLPLFLLFLAAIPTRMSIEFGQTSLMCLFFYCLSLWAADNKRTAASALLAGLGLAKYSFGVPLFFARKFWRWREALLYALPAALAIALWAAFFHYGFIEAARLPLQVVDRQRLGQLTGQGDLQTVLTALAVPRGVIFGLVLALLGGLMAVQKRWLSAFDDLQSLSFYAVAALLLLYHRPYDYVFLLPVAISAARMADVRLRNAVYAIVAYFWFVLPECKYFILDNQQPLLVNHLLLWALIGLLAYDEPSAARSADVLTGPARA